MTTVTTRCIDRLARRLAGTATRVTDVGPSEHDDGTSLDRGLLLRTAAAGALALSLGSLPQGARAASVVSEACRGGSRKACNSEGWKTARATIAMCDRVYLGKPGGEAASYECYVDAMSSRLAGMRECSARCPKPKSPKGGKPPSGGGGGGGGEVTPPPGNGPAFGCGAVDCVGGDSCCPVGGGGQICCAIGCARSGDGCCSSSSDC